MFLVQLLCYLNLVIQQYNEKIIVLELFIFHINSTKLNSLLF